MADLPESAPYMSEPEEMVREPSSTQLSRDPAFPWQQALKDRLGHQGGRVFPPSSVGCTRSSTLGRMSPRSTNKLGVPSTRRLHLCQGPPDACPVALEDAVWKEIGCAKVVEEAEPFLRPQAPGYGGGSEPSGSKIEGHERPACRSSWEQALFGPVM